MAGGKSIFANLEEKLAKYDVLTPASLNGIKVMFIKINQLYRENLTAQELYDAVRWCWIVDAKRANRCDYVFAVCQRRIVAIYAHSVWERITASNYKQAPAHCDNPAQFIGRRSFFVCNNFAQAMDSSLVGKLLDENNFGAQGARNAIKYNYEYYSKLIDKD